MDAKPSNKVARDVRWLKMYAVFMTLVVAALGVTAFTRTPTGGNVEVLDVERINVVESDGTIRMTISNSARLPDPILNGMTYPIRSGPRAAGLIFFNDRGDETGGLIFSGIDSANGNGYHASGSLTFDQHKQDQVVQISHSDVNGQRVAGVRVYDRADVPLAPILDTVMAIRQLPDGPDKTQRMEEFRRRRAERGEVSAVRFFAGKNVDKATVVELADPKGRPRLVLRVDSTGAPAVEFLDETGNVVSRLP
jgi:hypothetical protein